MRNRGNEGVESDRDSSYHAALVEINGLLAKAAMRTEALAELVADDPKRAAKVGDVL